MKVAARCSLSKAEWATSEATTMDHLKLPKTILPLHYTVKICPEVQDPFNFNGSVDVELLVKEETSQIIMNVADLRIASIKVWVRASNIFCLIRLYKPLALEELKSSKK